MSHSVVIVCLQPGTIHAPALNDRDGFADVVNTLLENALAPFDENAETEPYKDFEEGEPSDYWAISSLRKSVDHLANGTGIKPYQPNEIGWSSASSQRTEDEQRAELEREAALYATLPEVITWADVVRVYRAWYPPESPNSGLQYDAETGRAFEWSTYPKEQRNERGAVVSGARWDWWSLGGRWTGYFQVKDTAVGSADVANGRPGLMTETNRDHRKTDAAPKALLDFEAMRQDKMEEVQTAWWGFQKFLKQYPETLPWSDYLARVDAKEITIDQARQEYRQQPGREALTEPYNQYFGVDPYEEYAKPLEEISRLAAEAAVPGWSLLTLEGEWWERGKMGWFGMSDSTDDSEAEYNRRANAYLEALPDDVILAAVDVHI